MKTRALTLDGFSYQNSELYCEQIPLSALAEEHGTPAYVYSQSAIIQRVRRLQSGLGDLNCKIHFAVKACSNIHILGLLNKLGCGADIVSGGELFRSTLAQVSPQEIVFSGVGKTNEEIEQALSADIGCFNIESYSELLQLNEIAKSINARPNVALRINPNVDAKTHPHISTGLKKNKFGLAKTELNEVFANLKRFTNLNVRGLSCHIGSQIVSSSPFLEAWRELLELAQNAPFKVTHLNLGGGLGVSYDGSKELSLEDYTRTIHKLFSKHNFELSIEPGRSLLAPCAVLLATVINIKNRGTRTFYVLDTGMNDLIRPALYGAIHSILPIEEKYRKTTHKATVVGPVCETADTFQNDKPTVKTISGAIVAFSNAGAYGMSMASQYNSRPRPIELLVDQNICKVIRSRETYADLVRSELI